MIAPIPENIEQILAGLADGTFNRHEAVTWGEAVYQQWGVPTPGGPHFKTDIKHFVNFWAVCVDALLHENCYDKGEPYFYRNHDFHEWLAVLHREDAIRPANATIWRVRFHQVLWRDVLFAVCFDLTTEELAHRTNTIEVRGLDDLDYYRQFFFETAWGEQYVVESRPRNYPTEQVLCLDINHSDPWGAVQRFLNVVGVAEEKLTWVSANIRS